MKEGGFPRWFKKTFSFLVGSLMEKEEFLIDVEKVNAHLCLDFFLSSFLSWMITLIP